MAQGPAREESKAAVGRPAILPRLEDCDDEVAAVNARLRLPTHALDSPFLVEDLLKRFVGGDRSKGIAEPLLIEHRRYFRRRVQPLPRSFFPGGETGDEAIDSLASGAFASFDKEPTHEGRPAFQYAVDKAFSPPTGFLYFWRGSATIQFLRREGPAVLKARANMQRNVRLHVQSACKPVMTGAEIRWALEDWDDEQRAAPAPAVDSIWVDLTTAGRGPALIRAVLEAAGAPLTRAQISAVIEQSSGFVEEVAYPSGLEESLHVGSDFESEVTTAQLRDNVERFFASLTPDEQQLLRDRGYATPGQKLQSFRSIARARPGLSAESYRKLERRILERLRNTFEPEEMPEVIGLLVEVLERIE